MRAFLNHTFLDLLGKNAIYIAFYILIKIRILLDLESRGRVGEIVMLDPGNRITQTLILLVLTKRPLEI